MTAELSVVAAGLATVQDLGRPGHAHTGVGANGAADAHSAAVANLLVGNAPRAALIEITGSSLQLTTDRPMLAAVTGAAETVRVDGNDRPAGDPLVVRTSVLVPPPRLGHRSYLAINGHLDAPRLLGSVAPDPLLGFGRALRAGDRLGLESGFGGVDHPWLPLFRFAPTRSSLDGIIDVTPGPDADEFPDLAVELARGFAVSTNSDHMGLRLDGEAPQRADTGEMLSRGVPVGAVQVPPTGGVIVLLRGRLLTAGYPIVAVATTVGVNALAQLGPGDQLRFRPVTPDAAVADLRARDADMGSLATRVARAFRSSGLAAVLAHDHPGIAP